MEQPKDHSEYRCYSELLTLMGYVDPCPDKGRCNKKARAIRHAVARPINKKIEKFRRGTITEDAGGGSYYKTPVYFYNGVWYSA